MAAQVGAVASTSIVLAKPTYLDALNTIVRRKRKAGQTITENARRIMLAEAADFD